MSTVATTLLHNSNLNTSSQTIRSHMGKSQDLQKQLTTGSRLTSAGTDPASSAISNRISATTSVLKQAVHNASQGAAMSHVVDTNLQECIHMISEGLVLTTQMNNSALGDEQRKMAQNMFYSMFGDPETSSSPGALMELVERSRWNDVKFFEGGDVVGYKPEKGNDSVQSRLIAPLPNTFDPQTPVDSTKCGGLFEGTVSNISVNSDKKDGYSVSFKVGTDLFQGSFKLKENLWVFRCEASGSQLTLKTAKNDGFKSAVDVEGALNKVFGIGTENPVVLRSSNYTDASDAKNFLSGLNIELDKATVSPGLYAGYIQTNPDGKMGQLVLTNGSKSITQPLNKDVDLGNGIKLHFKEIPKAPLQNFIFQVSNDKQFTFQTGGLSGDITTFNVPKMTKQSLRLENMRIDTVENAASANKQLNFALEQLNTIRSQLGAGQKAIETAKEGTEASIENLQAAGSTFKDVDVIDALGEKTATSMLLEVSLGMLPKVFEPMQQLVQAIKSV